MADPIIEVQALSKRFVTPFSMADRIAKLLGARVDRKIVRALDEIDFQILQGEVVGMVGVSGSGKSTLGRIVAGVTEPTDGRLRYRGRAVETLTANERRAAMLSVQLIFQDSMASLNPRRRVVDIVGEAPVVHGITTRSEMNEYVADMLTWVGLDPLVQRRYPHQFSGGQRARIGIARALAVKPDVIVCDEATAALDVSIQAQVLNLFMKLRSDLGLTYLFISDDLSVVQHLADRVGVMYLGRIVEYGPSDALFKNPAHPYTRALLADRPRFETKRRHFAALKGEPPSPLNPPSGCHFHPRCPMAVERCKSERPRLKEGASAHFAACHLHG